MGYGTLPLTIKVLLPAYLNWWLLSRSDYTEHARVLCSSGRHTISIPQTHTQPFYSCLDFVRDNQGELVPYQKVHFTIFWIFWCKMKITQADAPTIRMDCHLIQTNWCPYLCHPHHFYAGCPSWHNPLNLSWLGTGTKYSGLVAQ